MMEIDVYISVMEYFRNECTAYSSWTTQWPMLKAHTFKAIRISGHYSCKSGHLESERKYIMMLYRSLETRNKSVPVQMESSIASFFACILAQYGYFKISYSPLIFNMDLNSGGGPMMNYLRNTITYSSSTRMCNAFYMMTCVFIYKHII